MKTRIIAGIAMAVLSLLGLFLLPNAGFSLAALVILLIGLHEWRMMAQQSLENYLRAAVLLSLLACLSFYTALPAHWIMTAGVIYWLWQTASLNRPALTPSGLSLLKGVFALWFAWAALSALHASNPSLLLLALLMVGVADSSAYFGGKCFGGKYFGGKYFGGKYFAKGKLAPNISPGKTWEGVLSGVFGAVIVSLIYCAVSAVAARTLSQYALVAVLAVAVSMISVVGDLSVSKLKRAAAMKDSGHLIPGHGGVLDRIDGLLAGLPLFAFCWPFIA